MQSWGGTPRRATGPVVRGGDERVSLGLVHLGVEDRQKVVELLHAAILIRERIVALRVETVGHVADAADRLNLEVFGALVGSESHGATLTARCIFETKAVSVALSVNGKVIRYDWLPEMKLITRSRAGRPG
jgi:hypothetical protein